MKILKIILSAGAIVAGSTAVFIYLGIYPPGADEPHSAVVHRILQVSRDRAIAVRADGLNVPDLGDAAMIRQGAGNYAAMCSGCHLGPGVLDHQARHQDVRHAGLGQEYRRQLHLGFGGIS